MPGAATLPVAIEFPTRTKGVGVAVMRGLHVENAPDLSVLTTLRSKRATDAESTIEHQLFGRDIFGSDARRGEAARAIEPLVLAALRESVEMAIPRDDAPQRLRR